MNARTVVSIITLLAASSLSFGQRSVFPEAPSSGSSVSNELGSTTGAPIGTTRGAIAITVKQINNAPVADAHVEARDLATGQIAASGYTNSLGFVEFPSVPAGNYEVVATSGLIEVHERADTHLGDSNITLRVPSETSNGVGGRDTVSVAQFKVPGKARDEYKKAQEALSKRKTDECAKHIAKALEIYPNYADALTLRGVLAMDALKADAAMNDFDAAIKADASYPLAYLAMGATYNTLSKFDDAIRVLERGIALSPSSWQGYFELGKAQIGKASYDAALRALDKAQSMGPADYPLLHLVKAHALLGLKDYTNAMGELQAFLEKAPKDGQQAQDARNLLGKVQAFTASGTK